MHKEHILAHSSSCEPLHSKNELHDKNDTSPSVFLASFIFFSFSLVISFSFLSYLLTKMCKSHSSLIPLVVMASILPVSFYEYHWLDPFIFPITWTLKNANPCFKNDTSFPPSYCTCTILKHGNTSTFCSIPTYFKSYTSKSLQKLL